MKTNILIERAFYILIHSEDYMPIAQLAEQLGISRRTMSRHMEPLRQMAKEKGLTLVSCQGRGIRIIGNHVRRLKLSAPSLMKDDLTSQRRNLIACDLLQNQNPVKSYYYQKHFSLSKNRLNKDLSWLENKFSEEGLTLHRKQGTGIYLTGTERSFRRAIITFLYDTIPFNKLIQAVSPAGGELVQNYGNHLMQITDKRIFLHIKEILQETFPEKDSVLVESARIGLVIHIAVAIERFQRGDGVKMTEEELGRLRPLPEYVTAEEIKRKLEQRLSISLPDDEVGYIAMHLKGARTYRIADTSEDIQARQQAKMIADEMIDLVSRKYHVDLNHQTLFYDNLVTHLITAVKRIELGLRIRNSLLSDIKQQFPQIYQISEEVSKILKRHLHKPVPEDEIGFLAMHFGAALEHGGGGSVRPCKAVVACSSGMGTSQMLASRVEKEFPEIEIVGVLPIAKVTEDYLDEKEIDLVLSILPIDGLSKPCIVMNPLFSEEDRQLLRKTINALPFQNLLQKQSEIAKTQLSEKLEDLKTRLELSLMLMKAQPLDRCEQVDRIRTRFGDIAVCLSQDADCHVGVSDDKFMVAFPEEEISAHRLALLRLLNYIARQDEFQCIFLSRQDQSKVEGVLVSLLKKYSEAILEETGKRLREIRVAKICRPAKRKNTHDEKNEKKNETDPKGSSAETQYFVRPVSPGSRAFGGNTEPAKPAGIPPCPTN